MDNEDRSLLGHADTEVGSGDSQDVRLIERELEGPRYAVERVLGTGGVGVVSLWRDRQIGRRVASKSLRDEVASDGTARARFLREAQVQGQLEHPAVVPVYDLGRSPDGAPFFTMKSIRGETLAAIIRGLRNGDAAAARRYSRMRLLSAFSTVCLAADYAHERGVIHRDLKPANIMLGDYGEVYVLDWGLAKLAHNADVFAEQRLEVDDVHDVMTHVGTVMGTPGYVAPEQLVESADPPDPRCDVYSLGAILFEILTWEPVHRPGTVKGVIESTLHGEDIRPSARAPQRAISPELDLVCQRALARAPERRFQSARELHDALQGYLEGQRDVELRRKQSIECAKAAAEAAAAAHDESDVGSLVARRRAMRELGRALALDPDNADALQTMVSLLVEPPDKPPPEVEREVETSYHQLARWAANIGALIYFAIFLLAPLLLWMGIRQPATVVTIFALLAGCGVLSALTGRRRQPSHAMILGALALSAIAFGFTSLLFGPLVMVPAAVAVNATAYAVFVHSRFRLLVTATSILAIAVPVLLELVGVISPSYEFSGGVIEILPRAIELPRTASLAFLLIASASSVVLGTLVVGHIRDRLTAAERRIYLQAWHLREMVPGARPARSR